jgi:class 3 adenylate cyclase/tetratricopeptide (TPR) repeat protein
LTGPGEDRHCASCGESNPVRARFCLGCGSPLEADSGGERRIVTVVFADLSGFTAYSEGSDVEDVRAIAQETAGRLGEIVERYGGFVDKIIGDCVMAVFGAPVAHEDDPERAVRAALDMQACVRENAERFAGLTLCVGMQTGEAMWSQVGSDGRYTVLGDTVNTAARLQGAAGKGEIYIGLPTYTAVADVIECTELEPIKAKNKAEPVPAWLAVGVMGAKASPRAVVAPFVGREAELSRLHEIWENVRTNRRTFGVTVIGSPGVGKSRLVSALTDEAAESALVLRGRCLPYGEGITYWPVIEIIQEVAGIRHDDDTETVSTKLGVLLESLEYDDLDELRTMAVALANLIGAPTTPRGTYSATEISRGELHWGLRRILELGARNAPLVLVLEDLHWAEPTLLDLIESIFDSEADAPILGIITARPEFKNIGANLLEPGTHRRVVELEALTDDAAKRIVNEMLGSTDIPDATLADLLHSAGGNPLFLEEIVQMWRESGGELTVPTGLQALIDSRLDRLSPAERRVVTRAAVVGDVFWDRTVGYLDPQVPDLDAALDGLEARDLIRSHPDSTLSGHREYAFKHGLIRDAAYGRLAKAERAALHERCGTWIGDLPTGEQEFVEIIAYHLEQACLLASQLSFGLANAPTLAAARALERAYKRAEARQGMQEADRFLDRAIGLLGDGYPEKSTELRLWRCRLVAGLGRFDEAQELAHRVAEDAGELNRLDLRCRALISLAELQVNIGAASEARTNVQEAEEIARRISDPQLRVRAGWTRAAIHEFYDADPEAAGEALRSAVALAEEVNDAEGILTARMRLGALLFNRGNLGAASKQFERCIELAREQGSLRSQAWHSAFIGLIRYHCGPRDQAADLFTHASDWMERTNDRYMQVQTFVWRSSLALSTGDIEGSLRLLRAAERIVRDIGGPLFVNVSRHLAEALARQGRSAEVREIAEAARAQTPEEDPLAQADLLVTEAFAIAAADGDAARRNFTQALPILESQDDKIALGEVRLAYARLLLNLGDETSATDQLERARELYARIGAHATVAEIDGEVARIRDLSLGAGVSEPIV